MKLKLIAVVSLLVVGGVACSKSTTPNANPTTASSEPTTVTSTPGTPPSSSPPVVSKNRVVASDTLKFTPSSLKIKKGESVTWTNTGQAPHTVTFKTFKYDHPLDAGASVSYRFISTGKFNYMCKIHPQMLGSITVS